MRSLLSMMSIVPFLMSHTAPSRPAARSDAVPSVAAPAIVVVDGSLLSRRVILADVGENVRLFVQFSGPLPPGDAEAARESFRRRPHLDLWLFWGLKWYSAATDTASWAKLKPQDADEHARFYPARKGEEAIIELDGTHGVAPSVRRVSPEALSILKAHGIPVYSPR